MEGLHREVIENINAIGKPVYSLDIPSGVNGDTGRLMGTAIRAAATVTFGLPKRGNLLYPGFLCGGKLYVTHISFPPELYDSESIGVEVNDPPPLPARKAWGHKGDFGDVLFVAGAAGYYGAPAFSALSFLKAGGGYSRLAAPASMIPGIAAQAGEIVFVPQRETASGSIASRNKSALLELAGRVDMVVLGPGIQDRLFKELEKELGDTIPKVVVEAQRRFTKTGFYSIEQVSDEGNFRTQLALRGLGNLRDIKIGPPGLVMRIDNAAGHLMTVGMVQGLFEMAFDVESNVEWALSDKGNLQVEVKPKA